ncbi:MAG: sigma-54-dependent Fis family transcriptional regulator [Candidatus Rokubacteria bacterium]|nr:sigma-54-dependent Fis family transcriptional regulator [Candidatus Rokubacteria bacterium]
MAHQAHVLIVDDELDVVENWARLLMRDGYRCSMATGGRQALTLVEAERPDVVLTDLVMPDVDGITLLRRATELDSDLPVIVVTGHGTIESAVAAIRAGAFDYVLKPLPSNRELRLVVARAVERRRLVEENRYLRESLGRPWAVDGLVARSPVMQAVSDLIDKAARSEANILIEGESGTGKELVARAIHTRSPRAAKTFMPVDCAALPEHLLESELFGHERGAFTGTARTKPGMFEVADGGTLFLDEVGELPLGFQAKLLRTVQEREIRRVGGTTLIPVNVRLVSATNRDLAEAVGKREFRDDLFYRLNVIRILLPPLRQRSGDVSLLAYYFLARCRRNRAQPFERIETEALAALDTYSWPGNVRELQNVIERACALAEGPTVRLRDLPDHVRGRAPRGTVVPGKDLPLREAREMWLRSLTQEYLRTLLDRHGGNISQAAKTAGVNRKTLHRLLLKYNLAAPEGEESPAD